MGEAGSVAGVEPTRGAGATGGGPGGAAAPAYRRARRTVHRVLRDRVLVGVPGGAVTAVGGSAAVVFARLDQPRTIDELVDAVGAGLSAGDPCADPSDDTPAGGASSGDGAAGGSGGHDRDAVRRKVEEALAVLVEAHLVELTPPLPSAS